jgi:hypothetical protein
MASGHMNRTNTWPHRLMLQLLTAAHGPNAKCWHVRYAPLSVYERT